MLRIALDHDALDAQLADSTLAVAAMRGRGRVYDPELLEVFEHAVGIGSSIFAPDLSGSRW